MKRTSVVAALVIGQVLAVVAPAGAQTEHGSRGMKHGESMPGQAEQAAVEGRGVINAVDGEGRSVNLSHEPIPAIGWPAMTMDMKVADGVDLAGLAEGAPVTFSLGRGADGIYVITVLEAAE